MYAGPLRQDPRARRRPGRQDRKSPWAGAGRDGGRDQRRAPADRGDGRRAGGGRESGSCPPATAAAAALAPEDSTTSLSSPSDSKLSPPRARRTPRRGRRGSPAADRGATCRSPPMVAPPMKAPARSQQIPAYQTHGGVPPPQPELLEEVNAARRPRGAALESAPGRPPVFTDDQIPTRGASARTQGWQGAGCAPPAARSKPAGSSSAATVCFRTNLVGTLLCGLLGIRCGQVEPFVVLRHLLAFLRCRKSCRMACHPRDHGQKTAFAIRYEAREIVGA